MKKFDFRKIPAPKDLRPLNIPKDKRIVLEIGCGVGLHPIRYAQLHPDESIFAFERTSEKFQKFAGRLLRHPEIQNITAIQGDAFHWAVHAFPQKSVDKVFVLYPNPYPKKAQENLRMYAMPAFQVIVDLLKPGGEIELATNLDYYCEGCVSEFVKDYPLELRERTLLNASAVPRTHFEKKYLARGDKCWNLRFQYKKNPK